MFNMQVKMIPHIMKIFGQALCIIMLILWAMNYYLYTTSQATDFLISCC